MNLSSAPTIAINEPSERMLKAYATSDAQIQFVAPKCWEAFL